MENPDDDPVFLTVDEVSRILRLSRMSIYRMVKAGELPSRQFGRSVRIYASAVEALCRRDQS